MMGPGSTAHQSTVAAVSASTGTAALIVRLKPELVIVLALLQSHRVLGLERHDRRHAKRRHKGHSAGNCAGP